MMVKHVISQRHPVHDIEAAILNLCYPDDIFFYDTSKRLLRSKGSSSFLHSNDSEKQVVLNFHI